MKYVHTLKLRRFLLGTTTGRILHGNRYKLQQDSYNQHQKQCVTYLRETIGSRSIGVETVQLPACMCIEFNPFLENYFLAGYKDGVIRYCCLWVLLNHGKLFSFLYCSIFRVGNSTSLCLWDGLSSDLSAVCSLEWSLHRPSVFLCSLACGTILLWDLLLSTHVRIPKSVMHAVKLQLVCIRQQLFVKKLLAKRAS